MKNNPFKKNPFQLVAILTIVPIGIYAAYTYVQSLVKDDIALPIGIMLVGSVIFLSLLLFSTKWAIEGV